MNFAKKVTQLTIYLSWLDKYILQNFSILLVFIFYFYLTIYFFFLFEITLKQKYNLR